MFRRRSNEAVRVREHEHTKYAKYNSDHQKVKSIMESKEGKTTRSRPRTTCENEESGWSPPQQSPSWSGVVDTHSRPESLTEE